MDRIATASFDDIMSNPGYFGMPSTMEEIRSFVEALKPKRDTTFALIDQGSILLKDHVRKQKYYIEGPEGRYYCGKSLEEVQRVAGNMGIRWEELEPFPEVIPDVAGKCDLEITMKLKTKTKLILPGQG